MTTTTTTIVMGAAISPCGTYRYQLERAWDPTRPTLGFVMLNPSTASATTDDPTIRKCMGFARRLGAGSIRVVNLFAYRATDPDDLVRAQRGGVDIEGPENWDHVSSALRVCDRVLVAWGGQKIATTATVRERLRSAQRPLECLGLTRAGEPRHPLMLSYGTIAERWSPR